MKTISNFGYYSQSPLSLWLDTHSMDIMISQIWWASSASAWIPRPGSRIYGSWTGNSAQTPPRCDTTRHGIWWPSYPRSWLDRGKVHLLLWLVNKTQKVKFAVLLNFTSFKEKKDFSPRCFHWKYSAAWTKNMYRSSTLAIFTICSLKYGTGNSLLLFCAQSYSLLFC